MCASVKKYRQSLESAGTLDLCLELMKCLPPFCLRYRVCQSRHAGHVAARCCVTICSKTALRSTILVGVPYIGAFESLCSRCDVAGSSLSRRNDVEVRSSPVTLKRAALETVAGVCTKCLDLADTRRPLTRASCQVERRMHARMMAETCRRGSPPRLPCAWKLLRSCATFPLGNPRA